MFVTCTFINCTYFKVEKVTITSFLNSTVPHELTIKIFVDMFRLNIV